MGEMSELFLGFSASDMFLRDFDAAQRGKRFVSEDTDYTDSLPTLQPANEVYKSTDVTLNRYKIPETIYKKERKTIMANIWDKFDKEIDTEGLQKDVAEAAANGGQGNYKDVPHGNYEVAVQQMELKVSKKGDPMVSIWFKIVSDGEYKGNMIFYNQVVTQGFQIHNNNEMLRKMVEEMGADAPVIEFKTYKQYSELLMDIFEAVADNFEYGLKYTANKKNKDFSDFEITDVFVLE